MKDWLTEESKGAGLSSDGEQSREHRRPITSNTRDSIFVGFATFFWIALLAVPIYNLAAHAGYAPGNLTILAGVFGLMMTTYTVMSDRLTSSMRGPIGLIGIALTVGCWAFGPL